MIIARTNRLILRHIEVSDAMALLRLLNDPSYLDAIGDREVRTRQEAEDYCVTILRRFYLEQGYGLYVVECAQTEGDGPQAGAVIGLCGLVKREELDGPDLGYAYLPAYWGRGYAEEAARAVLLHAERELGLEEIFGVVKARNSASLRLMEKLGFVLAGEYPQQSPEDPVRLFRYVF